MYYSILQVISKNKTFLNTQRRNLAQTINPIEVKFPSSKAMLKLEGVEHGFILILADDDKNYKWNRAGFLNG